jgi:Fur family transcriptional regulator, ferric uptake regulator
MERDTRQRAAIRSAIEAAERPLSPPEILALAQEIVPQVNLATVYRNLKAMQEDGSIAAVLLPGESARFEPTHLAHHHHFRCNKCERVFDIHGCAGDALHTVPHGFVVERHELTLYGLCSECAPTQTRKRATRNVPTHNHAHDAAHEHHHESHTHPESTRKIERSPSASVATKSKKKTPTLN